MRHSSPTALASSRRTWSGRRRSAVSRCFQTIDFAQKKDWDNVSGRVALSYDFTPDVLGYVSFSRGFNSGNYNGGAFSDQAEATLVDPEILTSYEVGVKCDLAGGTLRLNAQRTTTTSRTSRHSSSRRAPAALPSSSCRTQPHRACTARSWSPHGDPSTRCSCSSAPAIRIRGSTNFNSDVGGDLTGNELPSAPQWNLNVLVGYEWRAGRRHAAVERRREVHRSSVLQRQQ